MSVRVTYQRGKQYRQTFYQDDEVVFEVELRDAEGNPLDLAALDVELAAKLSLFDDTAAFTITGTVVDATAGIVSFAVDDTHTGEIRNYYAEIEVSDGAGYTETYILFQLDILRGVG